MRNLHEPTFRFSPAGAAGVSLFFVAVVFMILFTLWFGPMVPLPSMSAH